jgi:hypothetical protein
VPLFALAGLVAFCSRFFARCDDFDAISGPLEACNQAHAAELVGVATNLASGCDDDERASRPTLLEELQATCGVLAADAA